MKISFKNDYSEGCHPRILEALMQHNMDQQDAYGLDRYSLKAAAVILEKCKSPHSNVHFVSGGTQANLIIISALLRPHESVISASTGHIYNNEAGAIEATGHKVNSVFSADGKLSPTRIQEVLNDFNKPPHQAKPKLVYISNSTELGTTYTLDELTALSKYCKQHNLYLFMDGARLGQALMVDNGDVTLEDIAHLTDVFYLGGTKNGALIGEAIVINNTLLQDEFAFHIKQKGAMLSKGRLLGMQFLTLMEDDLFFELAQHANRQALRIKNAFQTKGHSFLVESFTNQIFPILSIEEIDTLSAKFEFYVWKKIDEKQSAVRIITSWASKPIEVDQFVEAINNL